MRFIGIDPGATGGVCVIDGGTVRAVPFRSDETTMCDALRVVGESDVVVMEKVGGYVGGGPMCPVCKQQRNRSPGSSMFSFGRSVGVLVGVLTVMRVSFSEVEPQKWQAGLGMRKPRGMSQQDWKRQLKQYAQEAYPDVKVTLAVADAILLARYAMLTHGVVDLFEESPDVEEDCE